MVRNEKLKTQITTLPKNQNYKNQSKNKTITSWYPSAHPLKIWRKTGAKQHLGTFSSDVQNPCNKCKPIHTSVGLPFKMLGKNPNGVNKLNSVTTDDSCNLCDPTKGPVGTNSAGAKIRSAITLLHKNYYTSNLSYLKGRCNTYNTNIVISQEPGITYFKDGKYVWPSNSTNNSAIYKTNCNSDYSSCCNKTIYKPSNTQFSTQGAVSNSARLARVKYNTITTGNKDISKKYNVNFAYNGSQNNIYFVKNKTQDLQQCCYKNRLRMRG